MIRNLDEGSLQTLTNYINDIWSTGRLPNEWKEAKMIFLPKPNKPLEPGNLRPISLTSCLGKLMEHVVLARLTHMADDKSLFADTMYGLRKGLSTQNVLLRLHNDILAAPPPPPTHTHTRNQGGAGAGPAKAFDNVAHAAILNELAQMNVGKNAFRYIQDFLTSRTVRISIGDTLSTPIRTGGKGTPQGAVLSPFLFNIVMRGLPAKLAHLPHIQHSLYADDITLWTNKGRDGDTQDNLQEAVRIIEEDAADCGLQCSPHKSELLLLYRGKHQPKGPQRITLTTKLGETIPEVDTIKVLGLLIQRDGHNTEFVRKFGKQAEQVARLLTMVASRHKGFSERHFCRLIRAFIVSRLVYATPYLKLRVTEEERLNAHLRSLFKQAVGLPKSASNQRLLEMGLHNTIRELPEATRTAQESRLTQTRAGVENLRRIGYHRESTGHEARVPESFRNLLHFIPLPRHMGGGREGSRTHRVRALQQAWGNKPKVWYVDASPYPQERAHVIVAIAPNEGATVTASVRTSNTREAEEYAIALAINEIGRSGKDGAIISDSQYAIRRLERGTVANTALRLLTSSPTKGKIAIRWTPAHAGLEGNERADSLARELTAQTDTTQAPLSPTPLTGYRDILSHYRSDRAKYPEPRKALTRHQAVIIRQVQANALPNPHILSKIHPDLYQPSCRRCGDQADMQHILWKCPYIVPKVFKTSNEWEAAVVSPSKDTQLAIVQLAEREVQPRTWILQDSGGPLPNTT
ncbi:hypothetical protein HPB47_022300 [Ixodes persulcatus]|uniref:Uncharacterized protein n=1 Tax=Ixodes persulcatus TaxID=34615 RepID=A0AC60QDF8_IXOPE|nr:hypothetical protein HPB47_022300 [Ixodes persulcatus]